MKEYTVIGPNSHEETVTAEHLRFSEGCLIFERGKITDRKLVAAFNTGEWRRVYPADR